MSHQQLVYRLMLSMVLPMACLTSTEAHRSGVTAGTPVPPTMAPIPMVISATV